MSRTLILYATTEGHTARIVERIAKRDYEYTDWDAVARLADAFAQRLQQT